MKQTAVEWLYKLSKKRELDKFDLQQAKEMEKEQIKEAFINGEVSRDRIDAEEYYLENYAK